MLNKPRSAVAMAAILDTDFEILGHPLYSPSFAFSDFYLFPSLKEHLEGWRFEDDEVVVAAVLDFLESRSELASELKAKLKFKLKPTPAREQMEGMEIESRTGLRSGSGLKERWRHKAIHDISTQAEPRSKANYLSLKITHGESTSPDSFNKLKHDYDVLFRYGISVSTFWFRHHPSSAESELKAGWKAESRTEPGSESKARPEFKLRTGLGSPDDGYRIKSVTGIGIEKETGIQIDVDQYKR
ncbi:hypothetical protein EVAR_23863_1 [Eumeta japonica]|uniref:Histone-lysine N-methyltransferase SETMAR n=1 Tax=Eumeta variegata TaxID=151549 RepID=A0A4C1V4M2_EUMVA|nr:hypothetical protein EVAR_23863_1 [Eumeta japonica]